MGPWLSKSKLEAKKRSYKKLPVTEGSQSKVSIDDFYVKNLIGTGSTWEVYLVKSK